MTRDEAIDAVRGLLVLVMVAGHTAILLPKDPGFGPIAAYANATCFSGFLVCFGYSHRRAYFGRALPDVYRALLLGAFKTFGAAMASGYAAVVILNPNVTQAILTETLTLQRLGPFSEFLLTFALLNLCAALAWPLLVRASKVPTLLFACGVAAMFTTLIPSPPDRTLLAGLFFGHAEHYTFPLVPYLGFYLFGFWMGAGSGPTLGQLAVALLLAVPGLQEIAPYGVLPMRFPPTIEWLGLGAFPVLAYFVLLRPLPSSWLRPLQTIGASALAWLLISNITLFGVHRAFPHKMGDAGTIRTYVLVIAACGFAVSGVRPVRASDAKRGEPAEASGKT